MKDTGFIALLNDRGFKPINVGFMKDQYGRRGVSARVTLGKEDYAIWFIQKDFPAGIYAIAVTKLQACMVVPMYDYIETRDLQKLIKFIDSLKNGVDEKNPENITHPWTELSARIMKV